MVGATKKKSEDCEDDNDDDEGAAGADSASASTLAKKRKVASNKAAAQPTVAATGTAAASASSPPPKAPASEKKPKCHSKDFDVSEQVNLVCQQMISNFADQRACLSITLKTFEALHIPDKVKLVSLTPSDYKSEQCNFLEQASPRCDP